MRVGALTLLVSSRTATPHLSPPAFLRPFLTTRGGDIRLEYTEEEVPDYSSAELLFDSGSVWKVYRRPHGLLYTFETRVCEPPLYKAVDIDAGLVRGKLHCRRPPRGRALFAPGYPLDDLLFQHRLALEGGAEVHAAGVVLGGRVALFCGASAAGKSTLSRLFSRHARAAPILSDDRIVLRPRRGRIWAWGTPWHGDAVFARPEARPLGAVFFLVQAEATRAVALSRPAGAARLFARTFPPPWDRKAVERVLALCDRVAAAVPCYELRFRRDRSAVAAAREVMGSVDTGISRR